MKPASAEDEADLRAVIGPNANFYLARGRTRFNWAAFFLPFFWLGYRRMFARAFILFGFVVAVLVLEEVLYCGLLGWPEPPRLMPAVVGLTIRVVCGSRANRWYLAHVRRVIADVRQGNPPRPGDRELSAARGGTNFGAGVAIQFACFVGAFGLGLFRYLLHVTPAGG